MLEQRTRHQEAEASDDENALRSERAQLVRFCARLTGDPDTSEDLAQEALVEAWRNAHKLHDPSGRMQWLYAIARNVCLRWARSHGRELAHRVTASGDDATTSQPAELVTDSFDIEVELERSELVDLLDRAMSLLPPETRIALVQRYVEEAPLNDIAVRLGMSEGAVAMRLQRGRLQLRKVLVTDLRDEAAAFGLGSAVVDDWQETRIWCPVCGQQRFEGRLDRERSELMLRCRGCVAVGNADMQIMSGPVPGLFDGVQGFRPALGRLVKWGHAYFLRAISERFVPCISCGAMAPLQSMRYDDGPLWGRYGFEIVCPKCNEATYSTLVGLGLTLPDVWEFWKKHPRIQMLPERQIVVAGREAILSTIASVTGSARIETISARDTFELISVHEVSR
jgi:RNA polymerase sigma factor (sigma-70 family)